MMSRPGNNKGHLNYRNKLTEDDVCFIFSCHTMTESGLANKFNVSQSTVNHIKRQRTWKWLTDQLKETQH